MENYKGIYADKKEYDKPKFYEGGAHFKYKQLYKILKSIAEKREFEENKIKEVRYNSLNNNDEKIHSKDIIINNNNQKNQSRNNFIVQSLTEKNTEIKRNDKIIIPNSKSRNILSINNENLNVKIKTENYYKINKSIPFLNLNSNNSNENLILQNKIESNNIKNLYSKSISKNKNNINQNISNNLPIINTKQKKSNNNPIQILSIHNNNYELNSRNLQLDKMNSNSSIFNNHFKVKSLRENNNSFAKQYINPLDKIAPLKIPISIYDKNENINSTSRKNKPEKPFIYHNKLNSKSISFSRNFINENKLNNNTENDYNYIYNKNHINKNENSTFSITSQIIINNLKQNSVIKSPLNRDSINYHNIIKFKKI